MSLPAPPDILLMSLIDKLNDHAVWEDFYSYKASRLSSKDLLKELRAYIDARGYESVYEKIKSGGPFPLAKKSVIAKLGSEKKRTVYTYPPAENMALKLLTHLTIRRYDHLFTPALYSFRPEKTAKDAMRFLVSRGRTDSSLSLKLDVSNYFNSVPLDRFLPILEEALADDAELFAFFSALLSEPRVYDRGGAAVEKKGIMAGTPQACFFANLYLNGVDSYFYERGVTYARYSDDIILFADSREELDRLGAELTDRLGELGLSVNEDKYAVTAPGEEWTFLGFARRGGETDVSPVSVKKLKAKMRRKTRALARWSKRNGLDGVKAAKAFIRVFDRKLFDAPSDSDLTWTRWYFPVITTDRSLKEIDSYAQDCIRFLASGTRTKSRFNVRYEDLREMGYRSLVHEYYSRGEEER